LSNRSVYEATFPTANIAKLAADQSAEATFNSTVDAAKATYAAAGPSGWAAFDASIKAAQKTLVASKLKNAHDCQQTLQVAKDVLRSTGDVLPA
jgi:hypothetical protein